MKKLLQHLWPKIKLAKEPSTNSTWLELFFDLMYVIIFSSLLNYSVSSNNLWTLFEVITIIIFSLQIWVSVSMYSALVDIMNLKIRLSIFVQIFLLILLNYTITQYSSNSSLFFIIWIINMIYRLLWLIPLKNKQSSFQQLIPYTLVMISIVSLVVIIITCFHVKNNIAHYVYFALAIFIWINSFIKKIGAKNNNTLKLLEYMRERWGLIVLIVFAELLISSINHFNNGVLNIENIITLFFNIFYILNLWTLYFDQISHIGIKKNNIQLWSAMHVLLICNLMIVGISTRIWIDKQLHTSNLTWLWIFLNVSIFYLSAAIRYISAFEQDKITKLFWNTNQTKHIQLNIILGSLYLFIGPFCSHFWPKMFEVGSDISLLFLISNVYIAKQYSLFLQLIKNKKHTLKNWNNEKI